MLLIIESHVFRTVEDTHVSASLEHAVTHAVRQHRIFGNILVVTSIVRCTSLCQTDAPQMVTLQPESGVSFHTSPVVSQFRIER